MENNTEKNRFELDINGETVFANYRKNGTTLYIDYVEAPTALRGTGAAGGLMREIMEHVKEEKLKVIPICGYASSWINRHPEYKGYLA